MRDCTAVFRSFQADPCINSGATFTVCNVLRSGRRTKERAYNNNPHKSKNNAATGYQGKVKIEFLKGAGLLLINYTPLTIVCKNIAPAEKRVEV